MGMARNVTIAVKSSHIGVSCGCTLRINDDKARGIDKRFRTVDGFFVYHNFSSLAALQPLTPPSAKSAREDVAEVESAAFDLPLHRPILYHTSKGPMMSYLDITGQSTAGC